MNVTSGWSWGAINRGKNVNVFSGVTLSRNNWSLVRSRISNDPFVSQLGQTSFSLTAENGGAQETIASPYVNAVTFTKNGAMNLVVSGSTFDTGSYARGADISGNPAWYLGTTATLRYSSTRWEILHGIQSYYLSDPCANTDMPWSAAATPWVKNLAPSGNAPTVAEGDLHWNPTASSVWIETGYEANGYPTYMLYNERSTPWISYTNRLWHYAASVSGPYQWICSADTLENVQSNAYGSLLGYALSTSVTIVPINGVTLTGTSSWLGANGTATLGQVQLPFICEADDQIYNQQGVDWYTQTQRWTFQDSYARVIN